MRKEYDFTNSRPNPFASGLKRAVTIRLDEATIAYVRELADETGIGHQTLINSYLKDCAATGRRPSVRHRHPICNQQSAIRQIPILNPQSSTLN